MSWTTLRIAWRNLGRNRRRTGLALLAIGVGQCALIITNGIMRGYTDNIQRAITGPMIGHLQVHAPGWRDERAMDLAISDLADVMAEIRQDPNVENAGARIYAPVLVAPEQDAYTAVVAGVDLEVESSPYGLLSDLKALPGPKEVLIGYRLANRMRAAPGQEIAIIGQGIDGSIANDLYIVRDIIRGPADLLNQMGIVMALEDAQELFVMPDQANEIVIRAKETGEVEAMAGRMQAWSDPAGLELLSWREIVPDLVLILDIAAYVAYIVLVLVFIAAVAGIANTLMMSTFERMHEFGMLLALGSRPNRLVEMIAFEAVFLGLLGVALGTAAGLALVMITAQTGIDFAYWGGRAAEDLAYQGLNLPLDVYPRPAAIDVFQGLAAILFTAMVAAIWPASVAARLEPVKAMRA